MRVRNGERHVAISNGHSTGASQSRSVVVCRDHQAYLPNDALAARARSVASVFALAGIEAAVEAEPAASSGTEHYRPGLAPWVVEAQLRLSERPWFAGCIAKPPDHDALEQAAEELSGLCWGVAAAAHRLRTPAGVLMLVDPLLGIAVELPYELKAEDFPRLAVEICESARERLGDAGPRSTFAEA